MGLVIYKGTLLKSIEWESDRKKIENYLFFDSKNLERKKTFFSKQFFLSNISSLKSAWLKFESNPTSTTIPTNALVSYENRSKMSHSWLDFAETDHMQTLLRPDVKK